MRATLSQTTELNADPPSPAVGSARVRLATALSHVIFFWIPVVALVGCNEVETDRVSGTQGDSERVVLEDDFRWPQDPGHPVLEIDIATQSRTGIIRIELMPELAPATVARVTELANSGYYDGTTFHRVIPGFMIQGGDPNSRDRDPSNDGLGDGQVQLQDEFGRAPFERGVVGMGNTGRPNSTGGQFFIMHSDESSLDNRYTAIGRVVDGLDLVDAITEVRIDQSGRWGPKDRPIDNVTMKSVRTVGRIADLQSENQPVASADPNPASASTTQKVADSSSLRESALEPDDWELLEAGGR